MNLSRQGGQKRCTLDKALISVSELVFGYCLLYLVMTWTVFVLTIQIERRQCYLVHLCRTLSEEQSLLSSRLKNHPVDLWVVRFPGFHYCTVLILLLLKKNDKTDVAPKCQRVQCHEMTISYTYHPCHVFVYTHVYMHIEPYVSHEPWISSSSSS